MTATDNRKIEFIEYMKEQHNIDIDENKLKLIKNNIIDNHSPLFSQRKIMESMINFILEGYQSHGDHWHVKHFDTSFTVLIACFNKKGSVVFHRGSLAGDIFDCEGCGTSLNFVEIPSTHRIKMLKESEQ